MAGDRPWYREPETFIAVAALIVSVTAVVVGIYEAQLQRTHDRAEVWPHLEISTFIEPQGAALKLTNTGLGPAIVHTIAVSVDGKPQRNWDEALETLLARPQAPPHNNSTVTEHAFRAGDEITLLGIGKADLPPHFWEWVGRLSVRVCYSSVFGDSWLVSDDHLGGSSRWTSVKSCPSQPKQDDL